MRVRFSSDDLPLKHRHALWQDLWRGVIAKRTFSVTTVETLDLTTNRVELDGEVTGPFTFATVQNRILHRLLRTRSDLANDSVLRFGLTRYPADWSHSTTLSYKRQDHLEVAAGDFLLSSSEWPFDITAPGGISPTMLLIPVERLRPLLAGGRLAGPVRIPAGSPLGALLSTGFDAARAEVPRLPADLGEAVLNNLCGLAALAANASAQAREQAPHAVREIRLAAARQYVDERLSDPAIGPPLAAASLGISVRQLHLLFEPTGESFSQYVLRRRLEACRTSLASPADAGRSIIDIAYGWGFDSLSTFYRAFRQAFGMAPGDLRAAAQAGGD